MVATNEKDASGDGPLAQAAYEGQLELCAALIQAGAEIDDGGVKGWTALYLASEFRHIDIVKILLEHNASVDKPMRDGRTPLYIASQKGHVDVVQILLEQDASVDQANNDGETPLFIASEEEHVDVVKILLEHNASVDQANNDGDTPLFIASQKGHADIVRILLEHNASVEENDDGDTPLFIASWSGHADIVRILKDHEINLLFTNLDKDHIRCKINQDRINAFTDIIGIFESIKSKTHLHDSNFKTILVKTVAILQLEVFGKTKWREELNDTSLAIEFGKLLREIKKSIPELTKAFRN